MLRSKVYKIKLFLILSKNKFFMGLDLLNPKMFLDFFIGTIFGKCLISYSVKTESLTDIKIGSDVFCLPMFKILMDIILCMLPQCKFTFYM